VNRDDRYGLLIEALEGRLRRIRDSFIMEHTSSQTVRRQAMLTYARMFHEIPLLNEVMAAVIRDFQCHVDEFRELDEESERAVRRIAARCLILLSRIPDGGVDLDKLDKLYEATDVVATAPLFDWANLQDPLNTLMRFGSVLDTGEVAGLKSGLMRIGHELKGQDHWFELLRALKPWSGARFVDVVGSSPEGSRPRNSTSRDLVQSRIIHRIVHKTTHDWRDLSLLGVANDDVAYSALCQFHDYVIAELSSRRVEVDVFRRYADRVMRFEDDVYRKSLKRPGTNGNPDEHEFTRQLSVYLHDAGLNLHREAQAGNARADVKTEDPLAVTFEVKVLRPGESVSTVEDRLGKGLRQALTYRRRFQLGLTHLVVFDAWDKGIELPSQVDIDGLPLMIHHIELKASPSSRDMSDAAVRWDAERVKAAAVG
jgi:hypothetical protein